MPISWTASWPKRSPRGDVQPEPYLRSRMAFSNGQPPVRNSPTGLRSLIVAAGLLLGQGSWTVRFAGVSRQTKRRTERESSVGPGVAYPPHRLPQKVGGAPGGPQPGHQPPTSSSLRLQGCWGRFK